MAQGAVAAEPEFAPVDPGFTHAYTGGWEHFVGGGVAVLDCNDDRLPDLFVAGGTAPATLLRNTSRDGALSFATVTSEAVNLTGVTGAYPLDVDGDGALDLAVLRVGPDQVLRGLGDCAFAPMTGIGFESPDAWSTAFTATWEEGQSLPTLAFGTYVDRHDPEGPFEACDDNLLYRPDGDAYGTPVRLAPGFCTLSALFSDWGRNGRADLRLSNDRHYYVRDGEEQLWAMEDVPRLYGAEDGWQTHKIWGMGIASRDLDGDSLPEVFLTSMADQKLHSLSGGARPSYADAPYARGITAHRPYAGDDGRPSTGWHAEFGDVDNDGRDDLFIAKGNVEQMPSSAMRDPNNLLMQGADGAFAERGDVAGVGSFEKSRGAALADLDLDGRLDLVVVNREAPLEIYRNVTTDEGNFLGISLQQPGPNSQAVGAWIELAVGARTYWREVTVGGGHAGGTAGPAHFGLGEAETARLRVHWPDGVISDWADIRAGAYLGVMPDDTALVVTRY